MQSPRMADGAGDSAPAASLRSCRPSSHCRPPRRSASAETRNGGRPHRGPCTALPATARYPVMVRARRCGWWCRPKPLEPPLPAVHPPPSGSGRRGQRQPSSHNPPSPDHRFAPPGRAKQPACRQGASVRPAPTLRVPCALWSTDPAISNGRCPHRWVLNAWRLLNLEARMESCRRTPRRGSRPRVVTARRTRPLRFG